MPKKKKRSKKSQGNKGELDQKTLWIIVGAVLVIIIGLIIVLTNTNDSNGDDEKDQLEKVVDIQNCPPEFYKEKISIYPRDRGPDAFPQRVNVYEKDYLDSKGDYVGICETGEKLGKNSSYIYCTNQTIYPNYIRLQEREGTTLKPQERWFVNIIFDYTTCQKYGSIPVSNLELYECDLVEVSCSK